MAWQGESRDSETQDGGAGGAGLFETGESQEGGSWAGWVDEEDKDFMRGVLAELFGCAWDSPDGLPQPMLSALIEVRRGV